MSNKDFNSGVKYSHAQVHHWDCGHQWFEFVNGEKPNYCPNCGGELEIDPLSDSI